MAIALVGTIGTVSVGALNAAVTPAWGAGENRTAGNLLVCQCGPSRDGTAPTLPAGWTLAAQALDAANGSSATLFYRVAAGADAAPTIAANAQAAWTVRLAEFSGTDPAPLDRFAGNSATVSPVVVTTAGVDVAAGDLVIVAAGDNRVTSGTVTTTHTPNNGVALTVVNNDAAAVVDHYSFGYGTTTGNAAADSDSLAFTGNTTSLALASFKAASLAGRNPRMIL